MGEKKQKQKQKNSTEKPAMRMNQDKNLVRASEMSICDREGKKKGDLGEFFLIHTNHEQGRLRRGNLAANLEFTNQKANSPIALRTE